jgi:integrase
VLSTILSEAVEDELIPSNPVLQRRKRRAGANRHAKRRVDPLTREELTHLLDTCQNHSEQQDGRTVYPFRAFYPFFLTLARTGMRLGEAIALRWGDVDFHGGFIDVERAYGRGSLTTPKNGRARRVLMSPQLIETLRALKAERFPEPEADRSGKVVQLGSRRDAEAIAGALVFPNGGGGFIDDHNLRRRVWAPLLEAAELRHVRIHDLRHTYASLMMEAGKELHFVQEQLGHHSPAFTLSVYGHLLPRDRRSEVACLDDEPEEVARGLRRGVRFSPLQSVPVLENARVSVDSSA